jgi:tol-pal system protein YbgF
MGTVRSRVAALGVAALATGCSAGSDDLRAKNDELRRMLIETRTDLEEVKRDQEQLRATLEFLQYSRGTGAAAHTAPAQPDRWPADPWGGSTDPFTTARPQSLGELEPGTPVPSRPAPPPPMPGSPGMAPGAPSMGGAPPPAPGTAPTMPSQSASARASAPGASASVSAQTAPPVVPQALAGSRYDDGARAFGDGQYDQAIQHFRDYIHDEPQSPYADDAQFWIGESNLRKGQYSNAIKEFNQVVLRYAAGDRSAASLLKLADVFSRIGDQVDARLSLQKLVNRYPGSAEAAEAYRLLQEMGG